MIISPNTRIARGYNHNILHRGVTFHVQTEASHHARPRVTTHVFVGGRVVASRGGAEEVARGSVAARMKDQHRDLLRALIHDELALPADLFASRPSPTTPATQTQSTTPSKRRRTPLLPRSRRSPPLGALDGRDDELALALDHFGLLTRLAPDEHTLRQLGTAIAVLRGLDVERDVAAAVMQELLALQRRLIDSCRSSSPAPTRARVAALHREASEFATTLLGSRASATLQAPPTPHRERVH